MAKNRLKLARPQTNGKIVHPSAQSASVEDIHIVFSFCNMQKCMHVDCLINAHEQAQFLKAMCILGLCKWKQLRAAPRHGLGYEKIDQNSIKVGIPSCINEDTTLYAFRWKDRLPFVGFREKEIFHILWIERAFGDLYDHS